MERNNLKDISEELLHFVWKFRLLEAAGLTDNEGETVEILSPGIHNFDAGPDFFNARLKIGDTIWAGNVEIHVKASDWELHKHNTDKSYDNVILHAVYLNDKEIFRKNRTRIPAIEIKIPDAIFENYKRLRDSKHAIPCRNYLPLVDKFKTESWLTQLAIQRIEQKTESIKNDLAANKNDWEETFYYIIARNFGFKINALPFELLAKSLPLKILAKHKNNLFQIEALIFGQAGFLNDDAADEYFLELKKEYDYLRHKYQLVPLEKHLWKFMRTRPVNFPTIRLSQFANLVYKSAHLFSKLLATKDLKQIIQYFNVTASEYWDSHYTFNGEVQKKQQKRLGLTSIYNIIINTIVPLLFHYGKSHGAQDICDKAVDLMQLVKAESNHILQDWEQIGLKAENAFYSQALIQLRNNYCNFSNCLDCVIGNEIIKGNVSTQKT